MPQVSRPMALGAFPSETRQNVWILPVGLNFDQAILDPSTINLDLEIDTFGTFASVNAVKLTRTSSDSRLIAFQNGAIGKAFEVELPGPSLADQTWYWRARINSGNFLSLWTETRSLTVPKRVSVEQTDDMFDNLADENSYAKGGKSSNVYKMLLQAGRELDLLLAEKDQTIGDLVLDKVRDPALTDNFAKFLNLSRVATEPASHHRWKTTKLWKAFANLAGTEQGLLDTVMAFLAEPPTIHDLTSTRGWVLDQGYFIKVPAHPELAPIIVIYSQPLRGHSFILRIWNSWNLTYDKTVLEYYINRMKPTHSEATIVYETNRHWSLRYDRQVDWDAWTNSGTIDTTTNPGTIRLNVGATSGTLTSPTERISGNTAFDAPEFVRWPAGGTITVEMRASSNGSDWGSWITIEHGVTPSSLTIKEYMQTRVTLSRTLAGDPNPVLEKIEIKGVRP